MLVLGSLGMILLGIAVLVASALIMGYRDWSRDDVMQLTLSVTGCVLIAMGIFGCFAAMLPALVSVFVIIVPFVAIEIAGKHHTARQHALLWVLTAAAERFIPLVPAVEAFARQRRGRFAHRVHWLAGLLAHGVPLPEALGQLRGLVRPEALPIIHVGHQSGVLAGALRQAAAGRDSRSQLWLSLANKLLYLGMVVFFGFLILTFVMLKIVPSYQKIFEDFEVDLPAMTRLMISVSELFVDYWFLLAPFFLIAFLLLLYVELRYLGWIPWGGLPGFDWIVRRLDTAVILDALALATDRQYPLPRTIAILAHSYHKASIRRRLRNVLRDLDAGADWCESLLQRGLIKRADLAVLQAAQRAGNLPWALREMADSSRRRLAYRLYALVQLFYPPVILILGGLVMFFVVSLFLPLITLIQRLT